MSSTCTVRSPDIAREFAAVFAEAAEESSAAAHNVQFFAGSCSDFLQVELASGETLIVKRPHYDWGAPRLRASREAAALLRRRTGVIAPHHLNVECDASGRAIEAYWRIPLHTLKELWPDIPLVQRGQALRSWGTLLRRVHKVKLTNTGRLAADVRHRDVAEYLVSELRDRLLPALYHFWPDAAYPARALVDSLEARAADFAGRLPVLVHGDLHMGNALCEKRPRSVRCLGVIDLETAWAGPPEADIARLQVLYGPAFVHPLGADWLADFLRGYGTPLAAGALAVFRLYDLLNLVYYFASNEWWEHVHNLQSEIMRELELGEFRQAIHV